MYDPFHTIRCPMCNRTMSPTDLKTYEETDDGIIGSYRCDCGTRFNIDMTITNTE